MAIQAHTYTNRMMMMMIMIWEERGGDVWKAGGFRKRYGLYLTTSQVPKMSTHSIWNFQNW